MVLCGASCLVSCGDCASRDSYSKGGETPPKHRISPEIFEISSSFNLALFCLSSKSITFSKESNCCQLSPPLSGKSCMNPCLVFILVIKGHVLLRVWFYHLI